MGVRAERCGRPEPFGGASADYGVLVYTRPPSQGLHRLAKDGAELGFPNSSQIGPALIGGLCYYLSGLGNTALSKNLLE
jgi:hypothetical protein